MKKKKKEERRKKKKKKKKEAEEEEMKKKKKKKNKRNKIKCIKKVIDRHLILNTQSNNVKSFKIISDDNFVFLY